jgi:TonB family protein
MLLNNFATLKNQIMKTKFSYFLLVFTSILFAQNSQDKVMYLDSLYKETTAENYHVKRIIKDYYLAQEKSEFQYLEYYKSGLLKSDKKLSGKDGGYLIGEAIDYFENGNKRSATFFENKKQDGKFSLWYENGKLKEEGQYNPDKVGTSQHYLVTNMWNEKGTKMVENGNGMYEINSDKIHEKGEYKNGVKNGVWTLTTKKNSYVEEYREGDFIKGQLTDENGDKNEYLVLEKKPEPKKGLESFYNFISKSFTPSREALANKIKGRIFVSFAIDTDGSVVDIKILRGLGYGLDEEAMRILKICPLWIPGEQRGIKVKCKYSVPIALDFSK